MLEKTVRDFVAAMDAGRVDDVAAAFADDVVYHRPLGVTGGSGHRAYRGRTQVVGLVGAQLGDARSVHHIRSYADDGRTAFVDGDLVTADGRALRWTSVYRFDDRARIADWLVVTSDR